MEPITVVRRVAPEDIRPGEYISVFMVVETAHYTLVDPCAGVDTRTVRTESIPWNAGEPLQVLAVCLPYVLARDAEGARQVIDVRRATIVRVSLAYALAAFKTGVTSEAGST